MNLMNGHTAGIVLYLKHKMLIGTNLISVLYFISLRRLAIFMDDKSKELKERTFKAALQIVQPKRTTVNISIGLLSPDGQHSSTKKSTKILTIDS